MWLNDFYLFYKKSGPHNTRVFAFEYKLFKFVKSLLYFVVVAVESSVAVVYARSDQSSTRGLDDLNGLLVVQQGLNSKSFWDKAEIFAAVAEPELLSYSSDVTCVTEIVLWKAFAVSSKWT